MQKVLVLSVGILLVTLGAWGFRFAPAARAHLSEGPNDLPMDRLLKGNQRFLHGHSIHHRGDRPDLNELAKAQHPFAVIITCSDSRVPPELLFDQGFGDLFVVRTAGNVIGDLELGSVEYAVEHLDASLIVVLGHEKCGAVLAYVGHGVDPLPGHIEDLSRYIASEPEEQAIPKNALNFVNRAIEANILHGVNLMEKTQPILHQAVQERRVQVVGALYDIETGTVRIISRSPETLATVNPPTHH